jgi:Tol biopolymer transport system component
VHFPRPRLWNPTFGAGSAGPATGWQAGARRRSGRTALPALLGYVAAAALGLGVALVVVRVAPVAVHRVGDLFSRSAPARSTAIPPDTLLYTVQNGDRTAIWEQGAGTKPRRAMAADGLQGAAIAAPDGSALLYLHADCPTCAALYMLREYRSGETRILGSAPLRPLYEGLRRDAAFSADGRYVAFAEAGPDSPTPHVYLFDRQTGERRPLAPFDSAAEDSPVWSPGGASVAFLSGGAKTIVMTASVETGELHALNDQLDHATDLAWSPDGSYLSLLRGGQLWLVDTADGHGFALAAPGPVRTVGGWAPDSHALIATVAPSGDGAASPADGQQQALNVVVLSVDGGAPRVLASGPVIGAPRWSADGRSVAWAEGSDAAWSLLTSPASGGPARTLASGVGQIALDDWR